MLQMLLDGAQAVLGDHFVGLYLYGSLASGDFNPQTSDIDFLVVTDTDLSDELIRDLEALHARLWNSGLKWAAKLEGAYVPLHTLRRYDPNSAPCPTINEGRFLSRSTGQRLDHSALHSARIRRRGLWSVPEILDRSGDARRSASRCGRCLARVVAPMLDDPGWIRNREYEAFATLTMCRALYALEYGDIVSKPVAARWALSTLDERWGLANRSSGSAWPQEPQSGNLSETLELIRYTIERALA